MITTEKKKNRSALQQEIKELARQKNALILAHYYQYPEIQEIADFVGDSLDLSRKAKAADKEIIVFAGVKFMAETAKILNPNRKVLLPDLAAGCSLADNCPPDKFAEFVAAHPGHTVVTYINCSAEIKAMSDIICTSSNAVNIVASLPADKPIIFAPDANLGRYVMKQTGGQLVLWNGACVVHEAFSIEKLVKLMTDHPTARLVAHPESETHILDIADFVGSTRKMIDFIKSGKNDTYIVATEAGILHQMQLEAPGKTLLAAPSHEDNSCACSECAFMKVNTLEKLYRSLLNETPAIELSPELIKKAVLPLEKMLQFT
ncbi:quinolinate synthase NadA [Nafulsella turpanensis]|uniref:quinolinate synthase NadA n=1 Tax=Nafulsella turpanensis TaxID=1265690 RepID=UPI000347B9B6|nr:quinolinate synthase NadA [Nafulsella turpanensis]